MREKAQQYQETARALRDRTKPLLDALEPLSAADQAKMIESFISACATLQETRRLKAEKQRLEAELKAEKQRRMQGMKALLQRGGAVYTLGVWAARAVQKCDGDLSKVNWKAVEMAAVKEAMGEHGQSAETVIDALTRHSPVRADPASHAEIRDAVMSLAPMYEHEFERRQAARDSEQGYGLD